MARRLLAWCEEYGVGKGWEWWDAQRPGEAYPIPCQPINSYSSFAFTVAGVGLWLFLYFRNKQTESCNVMSCPWTQAWVSMTVIIMGPLSWAGHACIATLGTFPSFGANADQFGLWLQCLLMSSLLAYRVWVFHKYRGQNRDSTSFPPVMKKRFSSCSVELAAVLGGQLLCAFLLQMIRVLADGFVNVIAYVCYGILAAIAVGGEVYLQRASGARIIPWRRHSFLALAIGTFLWAILCWGLDSVVCDPDSVFQFHAFWHVSVATAAFGWFSYIGAEHWCVETTLPENFHTLEWASSAVLEIEEGKIEM